MFEIIGVIIYGLGIAAWWAIRMAWKALKYLLPLSFIIFGIFLGGSCADGCYGKLDDDYISDTKQKLTHEVTIYWNDSESDFTVIRVREDLNWCINRGDSISYSPDLYESDESYYMPTVVSLPNKAYRQGYVFKGLYDVAMGNGTQYVTESGYSLMRVTEDIELYAYWEEA